MKLSLIKLIIFVLFISFFPIYIFPSNIRIIHITLLLLILNQLFFRTKISLIKENILIFLYPFSIFISSFIGGALGPNLLFILDNFTWSIFSVIKFQLKLKPNKLFNYISYATFISLALVLLIFMIHIFYYGRYYDLKEINGIRFFYGLTPLLLFIRIILRNYIFKKNNILISDIFSIATSIMILFCLWKEKVFMHL